MVIESYVDLWDPTTDAPVLAWRCVLCGEILDPVIVSNRTSPPAALEEVFADEAGCL